MVSRRGRRRYGCQLWFGDFPAARLTSAHERSPLAFTTSSHTSSGSVSIVNDGRAPDTAETTLATASSLPRMPISSAKRRSDAASITSISNARRRVPAYGTERVRRLVRMPNRRSRCATSTDSCSETVA